MNEVENDFSETDLSHIAKYLNATYKQEITINQIILTANGMLVIFFLEESSPLTPIQRIAMFDKEMICKWDEMC